MDAVTLQEQQEQLSEYDFWQVRLFQTISESHPYLLASDSLEQTKHFIVERAKNAYEYYCKLKLEEVPEYLAQERTINEVLLENLLFSPTDFINEIYFHKAGAELTTEDLIDKYNQVKELFVGIYYSIYEDYEKENQLKNKIIEHFKL